MHRCAGNTALQRTSREHAPAAAARKVPVLCSRECWQDTARSSGLQALKLRRARHMKLVPFAASQAYRERFEERPQNGVYFLRALSHTVGMRCMFSGFDQRQQRGLGSNWRKGEYCGSPYCSNSPLARHAFSTGSLFSWSPLWKGKDALDFV